MPAYTVPVGKDCANLRLFGPKLVEEHVVGSSSVAAESAEEEHQPDEFGQNFEVEVVEGQSHFGLHEEEVLVDEGSWGLLRLESAVVAAYIVHVGEVVLVE